MWNRPQVWKNWKILGLIQDRSKRSSEILPRHFAEADGTADEKMVEGYRLGPEATIHFPYFRPNAELRGGKVKTRLGVHDTGG